METFIPKRAHCYREQNDLNSRINERPGKRKYCKKNYKQPSFVAFVVLLVVLLILERLFYILLLLVAAFEISLIFSSLSFLV